MRKTGLLLQSTSGGLLVSGVCAEDVVRIWEIFKMSNYDSLGHVRSKLEAYKELIRSPI
jgi:hypothetical protein